MTTTTGDKAPKSRDKMGTLAGFCLDLSDRVGRVQPTYDRRHGVCVARMRAVNRAFSLERVLATRQTRLARDEAEPLPRVDVGDFRRRLW